MRKKDQEAKEEGNVFTVGCAVLFRIKPVILGKNDLRAISYTIQDMMPYTIDKLFVND